MPVRFQHARFPRAFDVVDLHPKFAEHVITSFVLVARGICFRHRQHRRQPRRNRQHARIAILRFLSADRQLPAIETHVAPLQAQQLAPPAARFKCRHDDVVQARRRRGEQPPFFARSPQRPIRIQHVRFEPPAPLRRLATFDCGILRNRIARQIAFFHCPPKRGFQQLARIDCAWTTARPLARNALQHRFEIVLRDRAECLSPKREPSSNRNAETCAH